MSTKPNLRKILLHAKKIASILNIYKHFFQGFNLGILIVDV